MISLAIALNKTCDPTDFSFLSDACSYVDPYIKGTIHNNRRWEYALALEAYSRWRAGHDAARAILDVGGAGAPFADVLSEIAVRPTTIDPHLNTTIEAYTGPRADALFAISVLEHVASVPAFLNACLAHVKPHGLIFLTMDCWDCEGPDVAHFHWMRKRIFNADTWKRVLGYLQQHGGKLLGPADWHYHGHQLYGSYSMASLAVIKRARGK